MVGLVVVSHSDALARGVVALAREMGGPDLRIEGAGGLADDPEALGTDAERVRAAIEAVRGDDGVLVLMDLGSALMSAEFAVELVEGVRVVLSDAPLVEGAVAAAAAAGGGASLDEVAREARGALGMKRAQLGGDGDGDGDASATGDWEAAGDSDAEAGEPGGSNAADDTNAADDAGAAVSSELAVGNAVGLHARPAARVVALVRGLDADVRLSLRGRTVDAASLTGVVSLAARQGDTLTASASGREAARALEQLAALAADNFGDADEPPGTSAGRQGGPTPPVSGRASALWAVYGPYSPLTRPESGEGAGGTLAGIPVSDGIALGPARRLGGDAGAGEPPPPAGGGASPGEAPAPPPEVSPMMNCSKQHPSGTPDEEHAALDAARATARAAIVTDRDRVAARAGADAAAVFDAHLALLDDPALLEPARAGIAAGTSAARAVHDAIGEVAAVYEGLDEPLLRERAADVRDVGHRLLAALADRATPGAATSAGGVTSAGEETSASGATSAGDETTAGEEPRATGPDDAQAPPGVLIADELTPADAARLDPARVAGIATARGSATAHAAILSRALGLPAVVGLGPAVLGIEDGTEVLLDGAAGTLTPAPDAATATAARERRATLSRRRAAARAHAHEPAITRDGTRVHVLANLGDPGEVAEAVALGAEGVGLLRTEFLYLERAELPGEDEQLATLRQIAGGLGDRPLVVRTLDAGADKPLPALATAPEDNPFLGVRGVRLSLAAPDVLATQLRAILRLAAERDGQVRAMLPMVSVVEEVRAVRTLLGTVRTQLDTDAPLPLGIMIEVPAAALDAAALAAEVDFFSIGTNDLTQYTLAAERGNPALQPLLAGLREPVRTLVRMAVAAAARTEAPTPVAVCGELAGDPAAATQLVRDGVRELSMSPALIPEAKAALRELDLA